MDRKEFEEIVGGVFVRDISIGIIRQQLNRTPEEVARDNWAHNVREKVASCEEAQWMPIAKANATRQERIRIIAFALLPPIIFLAGLGLINRTTRKISTIVAKVIATIGALSAAVVIAIFVGDISNKYYDIVISSLERYPPIQQSWNLAF
jgi:hypothetical protein